MPFRLQYRRYHLPFTTPVRTAHGLWTLRSGLIIRAEDPGGRVGYGEAAPIPWFGTETPEAAEAACRALGERIEDGVVEGLPDSLPCLRQALGSAIARPQPGAASTAPVAGAAGRPADPPARTALAVAALLPAGRAALLAAPPKADLGFRVFKWKVGVGDAADELGILDDLLACLPEGSRLRLDANGAWDRRQAERWLERCSERPVEFVEQPVDWKGRGAADLLLGLAGDYPVGIALDESVASATDLERWMDAGWPGWFVVKPTLLADPAGTLARLARRRARVVISSALETAVGARAALLLALAWPGEAFAVGFGVWPLFSDRRFDGPVAVPFLRASEIGGINPEEVWSALG